MQLTVKALQGRECSLQVGCEAVAVLAGRRPRVRGLVGFSEGTGRSPRAWLSPDHWLISCTPPRSDQVSEDELVSTLKERVSQTLNVPVRQQRLLFKGKALAGTREGRRPRPPSVCDQMVGFRDRAGRPAPPASPGRWEAALRLQHRAQLQTQPRGQASGEGTAGGEETGRGSAGTSCSLAACLPDLGSPLQHCRCQPSHGPAPEGEKGRPGTLKPSPHPPTPALLSPGL